MMDALRVALPLVLAAVLIASATAKLRTPDDLAGWTEVGVPRALRRRWLLRLHPVGEAVLGGFLALAGGWLGQLAATAAVALMAAYTVLVARAARRSPGAACACFGARRTITRITVIRNVWLTALAAATAAVIGSTPFLGGALWTGLSHGGWLLGLAVAAITAGMILWPDRGEPSPATTTESLAAGIPVAGDGDADYVRVRTPAIPVVLADGSDSTLRALARERPVLLLAVSSFCGSCAAVMERRSTYRELLPEVDVRLLLTEGSRSRWAEGGRLQSVHDEKEYVSDSLGYSGTPSAVLLGVDGLLAGGPVTGDRAVDRFVDDIYEALHGERPARVDAVP